MCENMIYSPQLIWRYAKILHSFIGNTYWLKPALLNDGVDDLLIGHQPPSLCEMVLRVLLRHTAHAENIGEIS